MDKTGQKPTEGTNEPEKGRVLKDGMAMTVSIQGDDVTLKSTGTEQLDSMSAYLLIQAAMGAFLQWQAQQDEIAQAPKH